MIKILKQYHSIIFIFVVWMESLRHKFHDFFNDPFEWTLTKRKGIPIVLNLYSLEEFDFYLIEPSNGNLMNIFTPRLKYTLPNTPKILCFSSNSKERSQHSHLILGQKPQYGFQKLLNHHHEHGSLLELFTQIMNTLQMLTKKYGFFQITQKMINASKGPTLIVWISQNVLDNQIQKPNQQSYIHLFENNLIRNVIQLILRSYGVLQLKFLVEEKEMLSFQSVSSFLKENMQIKKDILHKTMKKKYKLPSFFDNQKSTSQKNERKKHKYVEQRSYVCRKKYRQRERIPFNIKKQRKNKFHDSFGIREFMVHASSTKEHNEMRTETKNSFFDKFVRDSGFTDSTAAGNHLSTNTSTNMRMTEQSSRLSFDGNKKIILSSFGTPDKRESNQKNSCKFGIKQSKIISEASQQLGQSPSFITSPQGSSFRIGSNNTKQSGFTPREDLERDLSNLFKSSGKDKESLNMDIDLPAIEEELNRLFL